jgi:hypothetical protein
MNSRKLTTRPTHLRYLCGSSVSSAVKSRAARASVKTVRTSFLGRIL